ncbi:MAG: lysoplasmalogenase [Candidatus Heimdallarchaeota archaeon]|nr:lysoplasmalogenase [Candidatus Heimdallarchaeota archaeon]
MSFSYISFVLASVILLYRMRSKQKKHFIYSMVFIVLASIIHLIESYSVINLVFTVAIVLSFIGDLFMAQWIRLTGKRTIDGAIAFGMAHITYMYGFFLIKGIVFEPWVYLLAILMALGFFPFFGYNRSLPRKMLIVNFCYTLLIVSLLPTMISSILTASPIQIIFSVLGVVFFMISDAILSYNEFKRELRHAKDKIAFTYFLAQLFLQLIPFSL